MKIAILYIFTGKYHIFWEEFYKSAEHFLLPGIQKEYFIFTDANALYDQNKENIHLIEQRDLVWPYATLNRFTMFSRISPTLKTCDHIFFFNANILFWLSMYFGVLIYQGRETKNFDDEWPSLHT